MNVYKYVSPEGALRYLRSWALRITPPTEFNDPFEMRAGFLPIDISTASTAYGAEEYRHQLVDLIASILKSEIAEERDEVMSQIAERLVCIFDGSPTPTWVSERPNLESPVRTLLNIRDQVAKQTFRYDRFLNPGSPAFYQRANQAIRMRLFSGLGVLCMSGSERNLLMWTHYAKSHTGALLEFRATAPCFYRRGDAQGFLGRFHRVWYSDTRPGEDWDGEPEFESLALTKAIDWAYEQELRLIWPTRLADQTIEGSQRTMIHLIDVPATALKCITLGCRAEDGFVDEVRDAVDRVGKETRMHIRFARLNETSFGLDYLHHR